MTNLRRLFLSVAILATLLFLSGCTTPTIEAGHHYSENVSSILISQDKQKIVFIGKTYHYIFDAPAGIVTTLEQPFHAKVSGTLSNFHVDNQGAVNGLYSLQLGGNPDQREIHDAIAAGYQPDASGQLSLAGKISGTRYQEDTSLVGAINASRNKKDQPVEKTAVSENLNKSYAITVTYDPSSGEKKFDKLISPIIVTSDGLYLLFNVFLAPVVIPMAISNVSATCFPYCLRPETK